MRQRARDELKRNLSSLFMKARLQLDGMQTLELHRYTDSAGRRVTARTALDEIEAAMYRAMVDGCEQRAIRDYVERLDALQTEVDALRAQITENV